MFLSWQRPSLHWRALFEAKSHFNLIACRRRRQSLRRLAALTAGCLCAATALAADLPPLNNLPPPPVVLYDWTGFYVGANVGYAFDHFAFPYGVQVPGPAYYVSGNSGISSGGAVAGGQIGYNYRFSNVPYIGHFVAGVEVDSDWSGVGGSKTVATGSVSTTFGTKFENFGTARARIGYDFDRLLVYLTGGFTYGTTKSYFLSQGIYGQTTATISGLPTKVDVVGIGMEYALTKNFSIKAEYLYDCLRAHMVELPMTTVPIHFNSRSMYHVARIGLNYKFDWFSPQPVLAKY
jgi:outer membrane immunogenic protein